MRTHRNPDDTLALRGLVYALTIVLGAGALTSFFPAAETTIITTAVVLVALHLAALLVAWRVREYSRDRADARAAAVARAAYLARRHPVPAERGAA